MKRWLVVALAVVALALVAAWQVGWLADLGLGERGAPGAEVGAELDAPGRELDPSARARLEGREAAKPAAPAPPPITGPRITGRVVDGRARGITGARVISFPDTNGRTARFEDYGTDGYPGYATSTDADGRFVVAVSKDAPFHFVVANAPGLGLGVKPDLAPGSDVVLVLEPARTQTGVVKDRDGNEIVGARVRALLLVDTIRVELEARSGEGGSYRLEGLPPERRKNPTGWIGFIETGWFDVTAEGFAPLWAEFQFSHVANPLPARDFTLLRGATIVGVVEDAETGKPVPGATVSLYSREGMMGYGRSGQTSFQNPYAPRVLARLTGDENGKFRLEHVPCGATDAMSGGPMGGHTVGGVVAWAAGYTAAVEQVARPTDGATVEMTLKLWPAATITGRVLAADGKPAPDVSVSGVVAGKEQKGYVPPIVEGVPRSWAKTGADGLYRLDGVPAARGGATSVLLKANVPRVGRRVWTPSRPEGDASAKVSVKAGETLDAGDLVLPAEDPLPTTTIRVLLPDGGPCFGASVTRGNDFDAPRTDADGRYVMTWGKPKEGQVFPSVEMVVRARGFAPTAVTAYPPGSGKELVEVTLSPGHRLTGSVVLADGAPGVGVPVSVADGSLKPGDAFPDRGNEHLHMERMGTRERAMPVIYATVYAAEDGAFVVEDLPDGPYHVRATKARRVGTGPNAKPLAALAVGVAADAEVELRIPPDDSPATGTVRVAVTEAGAGKAILDARLAIRRGNDFVVSVQGTAGRNMGPPGSVVTADPSGVYTLEAVPVGTYALEVSADGFQLVRTEGVEVRADAVTTVPAVVLSRGIAVVGRVVPPIGHDVKDRKITFRALTGSRYLDVPLAADGTFRVTGFDPGRYSAVADVDWRDGGPAPFRPSGGEDLVVGPGDLELRFDVTWVAAAWIGLAPDDARLPPAPWDVQGDPPTEEQRRFGAATRVILRGPDGTVHLDVTGVQRMNAGPDAWRCVLPGRYTARVEFPGGESRDETVDLVAGARTSVYFRKR